MAIEIKELRIKVNVIEGNNDNTNSAGIQDPIKLQELKSEIIKECMQKILEKIKEKEER